MEKPLLISRTHPKILFKYFLLQLAFLGGHWAAQILWPEQWLGGPTKLFFHSALLLLELIYIFLPLLKWWNNIYTVTEEKIKNEWGVIYKNSREISLTRIASISMERGLLDRIFGAGTLNFYDTAASAQPSGAPWNKKEALGVQFLDIPQVKEVQKLVEEARRKARY